MLSGKAVNSEVKKISLKTHHQRACN